MWYFALAGSAIVPSILLFWYIHSRDVHPEPTGMLAATFGLGAAVAVPVLIVVGILHVTVGMPEGVWPRAAWTAFGHAAIPEEGFKFLVLMTFCWFSRHFDEPFDGIVYGATASLGFATLENILYVTQGGIGIAIMRAFTAVPGHAFTGVLMGYFVGRARFAPTGRFGKALQGLLWATLLHGLYDVFLMTNSVWAVLALPVLILEVVLGILLIRRMRVDGFIPPRGVPAEGMASYGAARAPGVAPGAGVAYPRVPGAAEAAMGVSPQAWPRPAAVEALPSGPRPGPVRLLGGALLASLGAVVALLGLGSVIYPDPGGQWGLGTLGGVVAGGMAILAVGTVLFGSGLVSRRRAPA